MIVVLATALVSCGGSDNSFTLEGKIKGQNELKILAYSPSGGYEGYDTIHVEDGEFSYTRELMDSAIVSLIFPGNIQTYIVAYPGDELTYKSESAALAKAKVEGSEENELLNKFRKKIADLPIKAIPAEAESFVREHSGTIAAVAVFERHILQATQRDDKLIAEMMTLLSRKQPQNAHLKRLVTQQYSEIHLAKGKQMPEVLLTTLDGEQIKLGKGQERPTVVLFWATWMEASLHQLGLVQRVKKELNGKVDFVIVSLDYNPNEFKSRMGNDSTSLTIVCDGKSWLSPYVEDLGINTIPGNLLIGKDGIIEDRNIVHVDLEKRIRELVE